MLYPIELYLDILDFMFDVAKAYGIPLLPQRRVVICAIAVYIWVHVVAEDLRGMMNH